MIEAGRHTSRAPGRALDVGPTFGRTGLDVFTGRRHGCTALDVVVGRDVERGRDAEEAVEALVQRTTVQGPRVVRGSLANDPGPRHLVVV